MHETHYFKTILLWIFWLFVIALIVYWAWNGGFGKAMSSFQSSSNPFSSDSEGGTSTNSFFHLPWQPNIGTIPVPTDSSADAVSTTVQDDYANLESRYEQLSAQDTSTKVFGDSSPVRGSVRITETYGAVETDPRKEYIVLTANTANTAPVDITDWSLQSAYTGVRVPLPLSASEFRMGILNDQGFVLLNPGASAIVNSGPSPVGTSFRENICSGYLGQLQNFYPPIALSCPPSSGTLPFTPDNLKVYGDTCFDFLQSVPTCTAPLQNIPVNVNPNCRALAANVLSYNGCVESNRYRSNFNVGSWRLYVGSGSELWRNTHDIIRLLDSNGLTVDVLTY
jgi:hypothetical protein